MVEVGLSGGRLAEAIFEVMSDTETGGQVDAQLRATVDWFGALGTTGFPKGPGRDVLFEDRFIAPIHRRVQMLGPNEVSEGALVGEGPTEQAADLQAAWPHLARTLDEAGRFDAELRAALPQD